MKLVKPTICTHFACIKITEGQAKTVRLRRIAGRQKANKQSDFRSGRSFNSHNNELLWPKLPDC